MVKTLLIPSDTIRGYNVRETPIEVDHSPTEIAAILNKVDGIETAATPDMRLADNSKNASFTAAVGNMYRVDLSSASVVVTEPAAAANKFYGVYLETAHATNILTLASGQILLNAGESLLRFSDGTNWFDYILKLIACKAMLTRTVGVQSIPHDTDTAISFDATVYNTGFTVAHSTTPIIARRPCKVMAGGGWLAMGLDDTENAVARIVANSVQYRTGGDMSPAADANLSAYTHTPVVMAITDDLQLSVRQKEGAAINTNINLHVAPHIYAHEVLDA